MIEELHIFGVYVPAALIWCMTAIFLTFLIRRPLQPLPLHQVLWHPALLEIALFLIMWVMIVWAGDHLLAHTWIS